MQRAMLLVAAWVTMVGGTASHSLAHETHELPAGPIRDRHELMEGIGDDAKAIGAAMKKDDNAAVAASAAKIQAAAAKITALFPEGSTDPKSRAKPEIWKNWAQFAADVEKLESTAGALAAAAKGGGDVKAASQAMFGACKSCHDAFRVPEKGD
jgi:cytochrome c556